MPCTNIIPNNTEIFTDSSGTARYARTFYLTSGTIKGTIVLFFGGKKAEGTGTNLIVWSKGWMEDGAVTDPLNADECKFIQEIRDLSWRVVVLDQTQTVSPKGTVATEYWLEEYLNHWNSKWPGKNFAVGHSAGAYFTGLHIRHFREGTANSIYANGIFSYGVTLGRTGYKTDFVPSDFNDRPTLFLSGSSALENPEIYDNTRNIWFNAACGINNARHGWEAINVNHNIFSKICCSSNCGGKRAVTRIVDDWFTKYPNLPKPPLSECPSSEGVTNPDGCH